jgi:hypothetical protein
LNLVAFTPRACQLSTKQNKAALIFYCGYSCVLSRVLPHKRGASTTRYGPRTRCT